MNLCVTNNTLLQKFLQSTNLIIKTCESENGMTTFLTDQLNTCSVHDFNEILSKQSFQNFCAKTITKFTKNKCFAQNII